MKKDYVAVNVRISSELANAIDADLARQEKLLPGFKFTRSDWLRAAAERMLLERAKRIEKHLSNKAYCLQCGKSVAIRKAGDRWKDAEGNWQYLCATCKSSVPPHSSPPK
jgi:DNA-directed RNA polymerase subunit RPC12/RpoP